MLAADVPPAIVECREQKTRAGGRILVMARQMEGRPCWYAGRPGKPKSKLRWPDKPRPAGEGAEPVEMVSPHGLPPVPGSFEDR